MKDDTYNAFERDIAILHAYFGEQTMPGEEIVIRIHSTLPMISQLTRGL